MKKIFFLGLIAAMAAFTACKDDEVAKKYQVTVSVTSENVSIDNISTLEAVAVSDAGKKTTAEVLDAKAVFNLVAGSYTITVTGSDAAYNYVGSTKCVVVDQDVDDLTIALTQSKPNGSIIFKEIYSTGTLGFYWADGFYELVNNSDQTQYLDGTILGIVQCGYGRVSSWADSTGVLPDYYPMSNHTVFFPGGGTDYPLEPGQNIVVATRAINHSARELGDGDVASPVDLSNADWEIYIKGSAQDTDNPDVPNLEVAYSQFGFDFMPAVSGQSLILAKLPEGLTMDAFLADTLSVKKPEGIYTAALCIPAEYVIDAVDIIYYNEEHNINKTILDTDDAGYTYYSGSDDEWTDPMYSRRSLRRKCTSVENGRAYFMDTNNSSNDFILGGQAVVVRRTFTEPD